MSPVALALASFVWRGIFVLILVGCARVLGSVIRDRIAGAR